MFEVRKHRVFAALFTILALLAFPASAALQYSTAVRNAQLDALESTIGTSAVLKIRTGAVPANCAAADSGTVLATLNLPSDWMAAASSGSKALTGTWQDTSADNTGTAAHFRIYASDGTTCGLQGTVTATGGGGDIELQNTSIATGQSITITAFTISAANAFEWSTKIYAPAPRSWTGFVSLSE